MAIAACVIGFGTTTGFLGATGAGAAAGAGDETALVLDFGIAAETFNSDAFADVEEVAAAFFSAVFFCATAGLAVFSFAEVVDAAFTVAGFAAVVFTLFAGAFAGALFVAAAAFAVVAAFLTGAALAVDALVAVAFAGALTAAFAGAFATALAAGFAATFLAGAFAAGFTAAFAVVGFLATVALDAVVLVVPDFFVPVVAALGIVLYLQKDLV